MRGAEVGCGGADRDRTCDLLIANETLYQLSYDPKHKPATGGTGANHWTMKNNLQARCRTQPRHDAPPDYAGKQPLLYVSKACAEVPF